MARSSNWTAQGTSSANTAKTTTKTVNDNEALAIAAYLVVIRGAAAGADISVAITDENDVVLWQDYIGSGALAGSRCGFTWPQGLRVPKGSNAKLVVGAGGASVITEASMMGWTE